MNEVEKGVLSVLRLVTPPPAPSGRMTMKTYRALVGKHEVTAEFTCSIAFVVATLRDGEIVTHEWVYVICAGAEYDRQCRIAKRDGGIVIIAPAIKISEEEL